MIARLSGSRMLVFGYEAPTTDPRDVKALKIANPAPWITEKYLERQASNPELTAAQVLQLHGCVWAATETTFVEPAVVLRARAKSGIPDGERVVLGFDGSERRDETWLVACSLGGLVEPLRRWSRPPTATRDWRIPRREVHEAVSAAFARFDVVEFACDPPGWYSEIDEWEAKYGEVVVTFETRQPTRMVPACERTVSGLEDGGFTYSGPLAGKLAEHLGNCVTRETPHGRYVTKDHPDSPRKIDGAVASIIAYDRAMWNAGNFGSSEPMIAFG